MGRGQKEVVGVSRYEGRKGLKGERWKKEGRK